MTEKNNSSSIEEKYQEITANLRKTKRISPFWLLPFIALCIGAILFFQIVKERGTSITITFTNGTDGLSVACEYKDGSIWYSGAEFKKTE